MADIDLKAATPDTTLPTTGFLFGADSQAAASPSVYSTQTVATTLLGSTSLTGATVTADSPVLNLAQTWNDGGVTFTGLKFNATDTASAAGSLLMDLQVGGTSRFNIDKSGQVYADGGVSFGSVANFPRIFERTSNVLALSFSGTNKFEFQSDIFRAASGAAIGFGANTVASGNLDTILTRRAAANPRLGAADAAAPVAQTLSVQSVVAGTSNTAGANLTITGSQGTGTGAGGSIIFQVAPAGSSGTAQNALVDALTINSAQQALFANGSLSAPSISFASETNSGFYRAAAATFALSIGGVATHVFTGTSFRGRNNSYSYFFGTSDDVVLTRDAANTLALRNAAAAQAFRVYNTYTSATEFERGNIFWDSNVLKIGTEKGSAGGTARALEFQTDGTTRLTIAATTGNVTTTGSVTTEAPTGGTAAAWRLGTVASVSPTSPNRTIEVDIGGTIYYLHAKTTND